MAKKKAAATKRSSYSTKKTKGGRKAKAGRLKRVLFSILVLIIVATTVYFLAARGDGKITVFENGIGSLITPVQNAFSTAANKVKLFFTNWHNYGDLQDAYDQLSMENDQLKLELVNAEEALQENERLKTQLDARDTYEALDPIYAKVIARDAGPWFKTFSVNRGSNHGVSAGMTVVNGSGLIGRVSEVGLNYAKVICIIDTRSAVACLLQRTRDNGIMRGQVSDSDSSAECYVYYLPNVNSISPGDVVVTSGMDSLYPKGLKVGTVTALSLDGGSEGSYAVVTPSVDFQRIEEVFILRTVIETDNDELPPLPTQTASYQQSATPAPNAKETPTPEPTGEANWSRPTPMPASTEDPYGGYKVGDLIEDSWASDN